MTQLLKRVLLVAVVGVAVFLAVFLPATTAQAEEQNPYSNDESSWVLELLNRLGNEVYETGAGWFDPPSIDDIKDIVSRGLAPVSTGINSAKDSVELICDSVSGGLSWASAPLCSLVVRDEDKLADDFADTVYQPGWVNGGTHGVGSTYGHSATVAVEIEHIGNTLVAHLARGPYSGTSAESDQLGNFWANIYLLRAGTTEVVTNFPGGLPGLRRGSEGGLNPVTSGSTNPYVIDDERDQLIKIELIHPYGTVIDTWYPEGHPDRPVAPDFMTTTRTLVGSLVCDDGTSQTTVEAEHDFEFKIGLLFPSLPKLDCPEGSRVSSYKIAVRTGSEETVLVDKHVPDSIKNMSQGEGTSLWFRDENGKWTNCIDDPNSCRYWDKVPAWMDKYACIKDGVKVAPSECDWLKHAFDNPDKPIGLISDPISRLNKPDPPPVKPPLDNPDWPDFSQMPGQGSGESTECFPRGWGILNPVDWVVKPIECAFTPSLNLGDMIDDRSEDLHDTLFGDMIDLMELVGGLFNPPNHHRCGLLVDVELDTLNPLGASGNRVQVDTCTGPFAEGDSFRPILGAGFIIAAVFVAATTLLRVLKVGVGGLGAGE